MIACNRSGSRLGGGRESAAKWPVWCTRGERSNCLWVTVKRIVCAVKNLSERGDSGEV